LAPKIPQDEAQNNDNDKKAEERDRWDTNANAGGDKGGGACRYGIFTVDTKLALAVLGIDTLKHVGGIRGIMGKWKWIEL
jgi:hypothetical protein